MILQRNKLILGEKNLKDITDDICEPVETLPGKGWVLMFMGALGLLLFYLVILGTVLAKGMGLLGVNHPNAWGTMIITFVF
ncbi:MAG TPA: hydrogenase, partial [Pseudobdellovibrionaceae bacterium]|nr:hydrogenase [Pseudobdellovibrionaceae bacterium]